MRPSALKKTIGVVHFFNGLSVVPMGRPQEIADGTPVKAIQTKPSRSRRSATVNHLRICNVRVDMNPWVRRYSGRTVLVARPQSGTMRFVAIKITYCLIAVLLTASTFGQSLHQILGVEHDCVCYSSNCESSHQPTSSTCPFAKSTHDHSHEEESAGPSSKQETDQCCLCKLLAQLSCGYNLVAVVNIRWTVAYRHIIVDAPHVEQNFIARAARGPPFSG